MIELRYSYSKLDKIHYYSVLETGELSLYYNQWLWHYLKFKPTKTIHLIPYSILGDRVLAAYKRHRPRVVAGYITKKIEKHREKLKL